MPNNRGVQICSCNPIPHWRIGLQVSFLTVTDLTIWVSRSSTDSNQRKKRWTSVFHDFVMKHRCPQPFLLSTESHTVYFYCPGSPICKLGIGICHCHRTDNTCICWERGNGCPRSFSNYLLRGKTALVQQCGTCRDLALCAILCHVACRSVLI